ncbi:ALKBH3 [Symbiodinium sp. CCMP2592]|nr:ALKBH3 [Symbiodinium sp. CCMP2592]
MEFFSSHGVQALLDLRPQMVTSSGNLWTRRDLARFCSLTSVQFERRTLSPEVPNVQSLLAALRFSKPPTALLFAESDPRNAWRRELSDEVFRAGWHVLHVTAKFGELKVTPHQELFSHAGNAITWPPTAAVVPELQKLQWPCPDIHARLADGRPYLVVLPWETELLWCPRWLGPSEADRLLRAIQEKVAFQQPVLRFSRGLRSVEAQQPRRSAWVSDQFNSREHLALLQAKGHALAEAVLEAHPVEAWSKAVFARAEATSCCRFNALLLHSYDHGGHSMGFHSDSDLGLGDAAAIASFSLGATRTFSLRSQMPWNGRRIEIQVPMHHGSFLAMGPGFQGRWLHAVLKEPEVTELRVNGTLRFYDLPEGSALLVTLRLAVSGGEHSATWTKLRGDCGSEAEKAAGCLAEFPKRSGCMSDAVPLRRLLCPGAQRLLDCEEADLRTHGFQASPILVLEAMGPGVKMQLPVDSRRLAFTAPEESPELFSSFIIGRAHQLEFWPEVLRPEALSTLSRQHIEVQAWRAPGDGSFSFLARNLSDVNPVHVIANVEAAEQQPRVLTKGEQRHLLDGDRLVLNLGQAHTFWLAFCDQTSNAQAASSRAAEPPRVRRGASRRSLAAPYQDEDLISTAATPQDLQNQEDVGADEDDVGAGRFLLKAATLQPSPAPRPCEPPRQLDFQFFARKAPGGQQMFGSSGSEKEMQVRSSRLSSVGSAASTLRPQVSPQGSVVSASMSPVRGRAAAYPPRRSSSPPARLSSSQWSPLAAPQVAPNARVSSPPLCWRPLNSQVHPFTL